MQQTIQLLESIVARVGKLVSWLSVLLIVIIVIDVFLRYTFNITSSASFEIEWHLFGALFLLSAGWAFQNDKHVRVDVFYQNFSEKTKASINLLGTMILLFPLCYVGFIESVQFTIASYQIGETSPDPGGLPARFIIKSMIPLGFLFLGIQGVAVVLRSVKTLMIK